MHRCDKHNSQQGFGFNQRLSLNSHRVDTGRSYRTYIAMLQRPRQPEREGEPGAEEEEEEEPPKKRPARVTAIGVTAAASSSLGYPTLALPRPRLGSQKTAASLRSGDAPLGSRGAGGRSSLDSKATSGAAQNRDKPAAAAAADLSAQSAAERDQPLQTTAAPLLPPQRDASGAPSGEARTETAAARGHSQNPDRQAAEGAERSGRTGRGRAPGRGRRAVRLQNAEHVPASQRALDRAHNEAILGAAGATDEELARQLVSYEFQVRKLWEVQTYAGGKCAC